MARPTVTYLTPPRLASLPVEWEQLEYSSRAIAFARDGRRRLRAWGPPEHPWVLSVETHGDRWRVEAWGADPGPARTAARAMFSLDHPLEQFYRQVRREPTLRGTERRFRGLRLPRDAHLYEALLHAIVGQQLSVVAATAIKRRLLAATDAFLTADGVEVPCAPRPARLGALGPDGLRALGMSRAKARAIGALAADAAALSAEAPTALVEPLPSAIARLVERPGVGRWTAENALLRGVGRPDVFVGGDLGIRVALAAYGVVPRDAPEEAARTWSDRWYPGWGSYATLYLWRKLVADRAGAEG
jgi:3-methyladenine DNA glycosylase/8-oxoguanine DNA glycosylase